MKLIAITVVEETGIFITKRKKDEAENMQSIQGKTDGGCDTCLSLGKQTMMEGSISLKLLYESLYCIQ